MQKYGHCELCGGYKLVADYGYNKEYICVDCSLSDCKLADHVSQEMVRRHGKAKITELIDDVLDGVVRN